MTSVITDLSKTAVTTAVLSFRVARFTSLTVPSHTGSPCLSHIVTFWPASGSGRYSYGKRITASSPDPSLIVTAGRAFGEVYHGQVGYGNADDNRAAGAGRLAWIARYFLYALDAKARASRELPGVRQHAGGLELRY